MKKLIIILGAAITLALLAVGTALACHNTVSGVVACQRDSSTETITWTITNDAKWSESAAYTSTTGTSGTILIPGFAAVPVIETVSGATMGLVTLTVDGTWTNPKQHQGTASGVVTLPGGCLPKVKYPAPHPPQRKHHRKPAAKRKVSQPSAVVKQPAPITISTKEQASLGGGG